jgi:hypothetical protein
MSDSWLRTDQDTIALELMALSRHYRLGNDQASFKLVKPKRDTSYLSGG